MRYFIPLLTLGSSLALASSALFPYAATAAELKTGTQIAAAQIEPQAAADAKVVCSRRPLAVVPEGTKVASSVLPQGGLLSSNIIQLFCRDVRINTIVVRDYCAIIRNN